MYCYGTNTLIDKLDGYSLEKDGIAKIYLKQVNFLPGKYFMDLAITSEDGYDADYYKGAAIVEFFSDIDDLGVVRIGHEWSIV